MSELTIEQKLKEAIHLRHSKRLVYDLFERIENNYELIKDPTPEEHRNYINLYFIYLDYMSKREDKR